MKLSIGASGTEVLLKRRAFSGFTLLEVMLSVLIVGIFLSIGTESYSRYVQTAKIAGASSDLRKIILKIAQYRINNNEAVPQSLADINVADLLDPWGHPYEFLNFSTVHGNGQKRKDHNLVPINSQFDLYSKGADGESVGPLTAAKSRDDIIVANDGAYVGLASDY